MELKPKVIFEDKYILVINKPSGLVVNRAETVRGETLQDWIEKKFKIQNSKFKISSDFVRRSGIVHRLDKETSGLMIVAKAAKAFADLQRQFKERKVLKKYIALVHGKLEPKEGSIRLPLARKLKDRKKFAVRLKGKNAITKYKRLNIVSFQPPGETLSLVELSPKTGRTHQLRVHLKHIGHPVVADSIYLGKKRLKKDLKWCPRLFLHARYLKFTHPGTLKKVEFDNDLPEDLKKALEC